MHAQRQAPLKVELHRSPQVEDGALWTTLGGMQMRLAPQVVFSEQVQRGRTWVVLQDKVRNQYFRTTPAVRSLLTALDGGTLDEVIAGNPALATAFNKNAANFRLLAQLLEAGLVTTGSTTNYAAEIEKHHLRKRMGRRLQWQKPWVIKLPLFNPDQLLEELSGKLQFIWTLPVLAVWAVLMAAALVLLSDQLPALFEYGKIRLLDPSNLLLALFIYPVLKLLHELAHGLATKRWGGHVYEMGFILLLFVPVPYVDASASAKFPNKKHRIVVAASGVMVELLVAAVALLVWMNADSILLKDICFNLMVIGGVSTLFFNGNPLLKFDGYYVLSDALEIPNLSGKAQNYLKFLLQRYAFALPVEAPLLAAGEAKWLLAYGLLSGIYRIFISLAIALLIASKYFALGVLLALWALAVQLLVPLCIGAGQTWSSAVAHGRSRRFVATLAVAALLLWIGLFLLPVGHATQADGLIVVQADNEIKTQAEGFLTEILVKPNQSVSRGQALLRFENTALHHDLMHVEARIGEAETLVNQFAATDPAQAALHKDELSTLQQERSDLRRELANLTLQSPAEGRVDIPSLMDLQGRYFKKGDALGVIINGRAPMAVVVVPETVADGLRRDIQRIEVKLHAYPLRVFTAEGIQEMPQASKVLPSRFLGSMNEGAIAVDSSDPDGTRALKNVFQFQLDLNLPEDLDVRNGRVAVRIVHAEESLAKRLAIRLRRLFLEQFQV